jgi:hypothetical protein
MIVVYYFQSVFRKTGERTNRVGLPTFLCIARELIHTQPEFDSGELLHELFRGSLSPIYRFFVL